MGEIVVPIDITGEEKSVLAIFSLRQFFMVFPTGVLSLIFLVWGGFPFISGFIEIIIKFILVLLACGFAALCAFIKLDRYEQYFSEFLMSMIRYIKSQKVYY